MRQSFGELRGDQKRIQELLEGSGHYNGTFGTWTEARQFIVSAIHRCGTILDIGCANGFLLRCLQEWSPYTLVPYGIDKDGARIAEAQKLFPLHANHFAQLTLDSVHLLKAHGFPEKFDFVYWNVWNNMQFSTAEEVRCVELALSAVREDGRFVLGFYDESAMSREGKIRTLIRLGFNFSGRISNQCCTRELVWLRVGN